MEEFDLLVLAMGLYRRFRDMAPFVYLESPSSLNPQVLRPLPNALRADGLRGPYYGSTPPTHLSVAGPPETISREYLLEQARIREAELRGLRALLNAGVPINRLPNELLVEIFSYVQRDDKHGIGWLHMLRVCRYWFCIIATTPWLWRRLVVGACTNILRTGLARSKETVVSVETSKTLFMDRLLPQVLMLIESHTHRIGSLELDCVQPTTAVLLGDFLQTHEMPQMRCLRLWARTSEEGSAPALSLSLERLPKLRSLHTDGVKLLSSTSVFPQLRILDLTDQAPDAGTSLAPLINMVRNLVNIEELQLSVMGTQLPTNPAPIPVVHDKVELGKLRVLSMSMEAPLLSQLLNNIVVPAAARVRLNARCPRFAIQPPTATELLSSGKDCLPVLPEIVSAKIHMGNDGTCISGDTSFVANAYLFDYPFTLTVDGFHAEWDDEDTTVDLRDPLSVIEDAQKLEALHIKCDTTYIGLVDWRGTLFRYPKLRRLEILVDNEDLMDLPETEWLVQQLDPWMPDRPDDYGLHPTRLGELPIPELECLHLCGTWSNTDTLVTVTKTFLENRRRMLGAQHALRELWLEVMTTYEGDEIAQYTKAFEEAVSGLVGTIHYVVIA
ncbi:hypothetical protein FKP32DRAFT_1678741 [Trametes sanguinea]|nr:hypothetical protein FKP32DRAFT_1678741 [Trametes sanguinea]